MKEICYGFIREQEFTQLAQIVSTKEELHGNSSGISQGK